MKCLPRLQETHALTIDGGWREVADTALAFVQRFAPAQPP